MLNQQMSEPDLPPTQRDAEWALDYCTEAILQLEERFGPLE